MFDELLIGQRVHLSLTASDGATRVVPALFLGETSGSGGDSVDLLLYPLSAPFAVRVDRTDSGAWFLVETWERVSVEVLEPM